jgi:hypothetical protein
MERLRKSLLERIYLLSANQVSLEHWLFNVRGQSNNIYKQNIKPTCFSCSCPDYAIRKSFCKHLLFLIARVAINTSLATDLCVNKTKWSNDVFNNLQSKWIDRLKHRLENKKECNKSNAIGNDCSICFEEMKTGEVFSQCITTCKNYFHEGCIQLWFQTGHDTCPLCRGKWNNNTESDIDINISLLNEPPIPNIEPPIPNIEPPIPNIEPQNIEMNIITINTEETIKEFCLINNIDYKKKTIYYEFIKTEIINNKKKIILMEKSTGYFFEGNNAREILGMDNNTELTLKPGMLCNYIIFIQSTSSNRKLLKNQKIIIY